MLQPRSMLALSTFAFNRLDTAAFEASELNPQASSAAQFRKIYTKSGKCSIAASIAP